MSQYFVQERLNQLNHSRPYDTKIWSKVLGYDGYIVRVGPLPCTVGSLCRIESGLGTSTTGEVVRIRDNGVDLVPHDTEFPVGISDKVSLIERSQSVDVGDHLLGRVVDGLGQPLDDDMMVDGTEKIPLNGMTLNPFQRRAISSVLDVGIKNINALFTIGIGQRLGIIAGSGVGKSVLLSMITKNVKADVVVIGLIGERGREVASFTKEILNSHSKDRVSIVAVPADRSPLLRIQGAKRATAIAEYFRDQGKDVLLIMDSLTRVAHAQREVGLALGEQPTSRGYPPSVISLIPSLIERTGVGKEGAGSITSIYTILADNDDVNSDPVVDTARAILDGHIVLNRDLAQQGIYPAIDVNQSISRLMNSIVDKQHLTAASELKKLISKYYENRDLFLMGGYVQGQDPELDRAISIWPAITDFLVQDEKAAFDYASSKTLLQSLVG